MSSIELDTIKLELRLPADKLECLQSTIHKWYIKLFLKAKPFCKRKELESLIGLLHDASIVVRPGHTFLRCKIKTTLRPQITGVGVYALTKKHDQTLCGGIASSLTGMDYL